MTPYTLVESYRCFEETVCLHFRGRKFVEKEYKQAGRRIRIGTQNGVSHPEATLQQTFSLTHSPTAREDLAYATT